MNQVNEGSTAYLTVAFKDKAGQAATPASVTYRIDDVASGVEVRDDTAVNAASSIEITLTPDDNAILGDTTRNQRRRVTVTATYGASDAQRSEFEYEVVNLRFV